MKEALARQQAAAEAQERGGRGYEDLPVHGAAEVGGRAVGEAPGGGSARR